MHQVTCEWPRHMWPKSTGRDTRDDDTWLAETSRERNLIGREHVESDLWLAETCRKRNDHARHVLKFYRISLRLLTPQKSVAAAPSEGPGSSCAQLRRRGNPCPGCAATRLALSGRKGLEEGSRYAGLQLAHGNQLGMSACSTSVLPSFLIPPFLLLFFLHMHVRLWRNRQDDVAIKLRFFSQTAAVGMSKYEVQAWKVSDDERRYVPEGGFQLRKEIISWKIFFDSYLRQKEYNYIYKEGKNSGKYHVSGFHFPFYGFHSPLIRSTKGWRWSNTVVRTTDTLAFMSLFAQVDFLFYSVTYPLAYVKTLFGLCKRMENGLRDE